MVSTNIPQPTLGPNGFIAPSETAILAGVQADWQAAFGGNLNPALSTPQGQIASSTTAIIGDSNAVFLWFCNQIDPAYNSGRMQDAIGRIYFITRIPSQPTVVQVLCSGGSEVPIPIGALVQDNVGNIYACQQSGTIPNGGGSITLAFANVANGPIPCAAGSIVSAPYQFIPGWDSASNVADGVLGRNVETAAEFELRRSLSTGVNSSGPLGAILGAVLQVTDVLDAYVTENDTASPVTIGGVSIGANSLYVCILGGSNTAVAQAIWSRKAPGCAYTGNTTAIVQDPSPSYLPPIPSYSVTFETPTIVDFAVLVVIANSNSVPSNALILIQAAVISAFAGTDGGSRAKIGSTVFASRYYAGVAALGAWAQIVDIQLGVSGAAASFTGSITGTALTVTGSVTGTIAIGQLLQDSTGNLASGTTIVSGSGTSWVVSISQTVASETMNATTLVNSLTMNINEAPAVSAANIALALA